MSSMSLAKLSEENTALIKSTEGFENELLIKQFYCQSGEQIFIKKAGLLYKMEQKFKGQYSIETSIVSEDEYIRIRKMLNLKENEPCVVITAKVTTPLGIYTSYGTAHNKNTFNTAYLLEMAETRAELRAIRKATNCGFTSAEELPNEPNQHIEEPVNGKIGICHDLMKQLGLTKETYLKYISNILEKKINSTKELTTTEIDKVIDKLKKDVPMV